MVRSCGHCNPFLAKFPNSQSRPHFWHVFKGVVTGANRQRHGKGAPDQQSVFQYKPRQLQRTAPGLDRHTQRRGLFRSIGGGDLRLIFRKWLSLFPTGRDIQSRHDDDLIGSGSQSDGKRPVLLDGGAGGSAGRRIEAHAGGKNRFSAEVDGPGHGSLGGTPRTSVADQEEGKAEPTTDRGPARLTAEFQNSHFRFGSLMPGRRTGPANRSGTGRCHPPTRSWRLPYESCPTAGH